MNPTYIPKKVLALIPILIGLNISNTFAAPILQSNFSDPTNPGYPTAFYDNSSTLYNSSTGATINLTGAYGDSNAGFVFGSAGEIFNNSALGTSGLGAPISVTSPGSYLLSVNIAAQDIASGFSIGLIGGGASGGVSASARILFYQGGIYDYGTFTQFGTYAANTVYTVDLAFNPSAASYSESVWNNGLQIGTTYMGALVSIPSTDYSAQGAFLFNQVAGSGGFIVDNVTLAAVPEPKTVMLLIGGLTFTLIRARKATLRI